MQPRTKRLIGIYLKILGISLACIVGMCAYLIAIMLMGWPWGFVISLCVPFACMGYGAWEMAKSRLEYAEFLEKKLADQLVNSD